MKKIYSLFLILIVFKTNAQVNEPENFAVKVYPNKVELSFLDNSTDEVQFRIKHRPNSTLPWNKFAYLGERDGTASSPKLVHYTKTEETSPYDLKFRMRAVEKIFLGVVTKASEWVYATPEFILPDLKTTGVKATRYSLSSGACKTRVEIYVKNVGKRSSTPCRGEFTFEGEKRTFDIPSLGTNQVTIITQIYDFTIDQKAIVDLDIDNEVFEIPNSNNHTYYPLLAVNGSCGDDLPDEIDLIIVSPAITNMSGPSATEGESFSSSFRVYNTKHTKSKASVAKIYWNRGSSLDGNQTLAKSILIAAVNGDSNSEDINFSISTPNLNGASFGLYYLIFQADANNDNQETNESNNIESYLFTINEKSSGGRIDDPISLDPQYEMYSAYPNPAPSNPILVRESASQTENFLVYDNNGNIIKRITLSSGQRSLLIQGLASGTYVIKSEKTNESFRLVID